MKAAQPAAIRPDGVGDGAPARAGDSFELRRQLRGDRGPEIVEASEVRIEGRPSRAPPASSPLRP